MEESNFFNFCSKLVSNTFQTSPSGLKKDSRGISEQLNLVKGKFEGIHFPVLFKQESGKKMTDILDVGFVGPYLISDRMKLILERHNLTGWKTFPIRLYDKKSIEIFGYHGFSLMGHCAPIDYKKSTIIEKRLVPTGPMCKFYKGVFIDEWDGTDFFSPENTYDLFVTKRAADVLKENKITNLWLTNLSEYETDVDNVPRNSL